MGSALVDASTATNAWYGFASDSSPKILFPDSPSNLDISSLMASSAMELDALFREAGLSAGPSEEQRGWMESGANLQQAPSLPSTSIAFPDSREQSAQFARQGEALGGHYDPSVGGVNQAEGRGKWGFDTGNGVSVERHNGALIMADGEGFETDWEALGFGYRMSGSTQYGGNFQVFADQAHHQAPQQQSQQGFPEMRGGVQQSYAHRGATEFDQRFLDSHMGF